MTPLGLTTSNTKGSESSCGDGCHVDCGCSGTGPTPGTCEERKVSCADAWCSMPPSMNANLANALVEDRIDVYCSSDQPVTTKATCSRPDCRKSNVSSAKGRQTRCCDVTCLDELALRECNKTKCSRTTSSSACDYHIKKTRNLHIDALETIGCICRTLIARNLESCCNSTATMRKRRCARPTPTVNDEMSNFQQDSRHSATTATVNGTLNTQAGTPKSCQTVCCSKTLRPAIASTVEGVDVERGDAPSEHVVFTVHGMTCTGCETKLLRSLSALPAVSRPQISLLLSRAEFDLNGAVLSAAKVQARLAKETGFGFDRITDDDGYLEAIEVSVQDEAKEFVNCDMPAGVVRALVVDKNTVSLRFDPKVIGVRHLINHCFDSPLQLAPLRPSPSINSGRKHVQSVGLRMLLSTLLTIPVLVLAWAPLPDNEVAYGSTSLALATIIQVLIAGPFYGSALRSLVFSRIVEMDLLIVLSTTAAYVFSVVAFAHLVAGRPLSSGEFFETGTLLVTLIMVGRFLAAAGRQKAIESVSILSLQASTALLSSEDDKCIDKSIDARLLQIGDILKLLPETRVPTDGTIIAGSSELNESMVTGEARPVHKGVGAPVIAGSINGSGVLLVRVSRLLSSNTVAKIAAMVDEAKMSKPKIQDLADKIASWFVPAILAISIITFAVWLGIGAGKNGMSGSKAAVQALMYAIATLIVSCPCAIGLAVPMVGVIASGIAAENGVVVKDSGTLEIARKTSHVVFDKTGTLTQGRLRVVKENYPSSSTKANLGLLLGLVRSSKHPVSVAVAEYLESKGVAEVPVQDVQSFPSKGTEATFTPGDGSAATTLRCGNSRWLKLESHPDVSSLLSSGLTVFCFTANGILQAAYGLRDTLRPDTAEVVKRLAASNISVSIVSGDDGSAVQSVAAELGIKRANVRSCASPADKQTYVKDILEQDHSSTVLFVGDGTNDSVALAQATIGVHMSGGSDLAAAAADVVLTSGSSLRGLLVLLAISRTASRRILINFAWSAVYNVFAILLAAGAFPSGVRIPPQYAGLGEVVSVLPVILVAVQMRWVRWSPV